MPAKILRKKYQRAATNTRIPTVMIIRMDMITHTATVLLGKGLRSH